MGGCSDPGYPRHRPLYPTAIWMAASAPGRAPYLLPRVDSGLTGEPAPRVKLSAWTGTTPSPSHPAAPQSMNPAAVAAAADRDAAPPLCLSKSEIERCTFARIEDEELHSVRSLACPLCFVAHLHLTIIRSTRRCRSASAARSTLPSMPWQSTRASSCCCPPKRWNRSRRT